VTACSFCGFDIPAGTGKLYIKRDATQFHFCSSKCQRNMVGLRRTPRHTTWTEAHRLAKEETRHSKAGEAAKAKPAAKAEVKAKP
jgi:large subunit ribosomal protein L24e